MTSARLRCTAEGADSHSAQLCDKFYEQQWLGFTIVDYNMALS